MRNSIDSLPYKITLAVMSEIAHETVRAHSYAEASKQLEARLGDTYSPSYIWEITNFVGYILMEERKKRIEKLADLYKSSPSKSDVFSIYQKYPQANQLYGLIDGLFLNIRPNNIDIVLNNISNWRECKAAMVFSPEELIKRKPGKHGEERYSISKSDYDAFIGNADEFKFTFLDLLLRNGLKEDTKVILLSDGADWIQRIANELLIPLGIEIIPINDLYHTKENIGRFCRRTGFEATKSEIPLSLLSQGIRVLLGQNRFGTIYRKDDELWWIRLPDTHSFFCSFLQEEMAGGDPRRGR